MVGEEFFGNETKFQQGNASFHACGELANEGLIITRNFTQFRITLRSMGSKCHGQRKSLTVQLNSRLVRRKELVRFSCSVEL